MKRDISKEIAQRDHQERQDDEDNLSMKDHRSHFQVPTGEVTMSILAPHGQWISEKAMNIMHAIQTCIRNKAGEKTEESPVIHCIRRRIYQGTDCRYQCGKEARTRSRIWLV